MELEIIKRVMESWNLPPFLLQGWMEVARLLADAHWPAGLALWVRDALPAVDLPEEERLAAAVHLAALFLAQGQGHTLLEVHSPLLKDALYRVQEASNGAVSAAGAPYAFSRCIQGPLAPLFAPQNPQAPFVLEDDCFQLARIRWMEDGCIRLLRMRMKAPPRPVPRGVMDGYSGILDERQQEMIRQALAHRIFWVSGGPGTGKTTCIYGLLHALDRLDPKIPPERVALAAPTGKAAFRITASLRRMARDRGNPFDEAILSGRMEALTLHRLLEYQPETDRFGRHEGNPLPVDQVVVDESSMVDMELLHALLKALPVEACVVFVGDQDQLPAVGQGAPFQTAWEEGLPRAPQLFFRLERNYRAQEALSRDLERLLRQRSEPHWHSWKLPPEEPGLYLHEIRSDSDFVSFLNQIFEKNYDSSYWEIALRRHDLPDGPLSVQDPHLANLVKMADRAQGCPVLCAVHDGMRGTRRVNEWMHRRHPAGGAELLPGEPVMVQVNDYQRGLFNGDFGVVADVALRGRPARCAVFRTGERLRVFELVNLRLERAYAFSVHKSQGSEYDEVVVVLPEKPSGILTRELVYTALTRARRAARLAGDPELLKGALDRLVRRRSRLARAWDP